MEQDYWIVFTLLLAVVAFLYASVGHGGASGYLALGALFGMAVSVIKPSALLLNLVVSAAAFFQYYRGGHFRWTLFWPFAVTSVPASYLGSFISLDDHIYKKILGVLLVFAVMRIAGLFGKGREKNVSPPLAAALVSGALIGLLSGMIGIGGGIILTPLLLIFGWAGIKETAAVSALFIFVNSLSGLAGLLQKGISLDSQVYVWLAVAAIAGLFGSWAGSLRLGGIALRGILAVTLGIACIKLIMT